MNLNIKSTNLALTPNIKNYFEKKILMLDKSLGLDRDDVYLYAELARTTSHHRQGEVFRADINMKGKRRVYVAAEGESIEAAIDALKDEFEQQLRSGKDKRISLIKRGARAVKNMLRFGRKKDSRGSYGR